MTSTNSTPVDNCSTLVFRGREMEAIIITKMAISGVAALVCFVAVAVIIAFKDYRKFLYRIVLYLMLASLAYALSLILELIPIEYKDGRIQLRSGYERACSAIGFLSQVAGWYFAVMVCWIVLYLVILAVFKYSANKRWQEITGVVVCHAIPIIFNWIPFIHHMYSISGMWCWIEFTELRCNREKYVLGLINQYALFYGPLSLIVLFTFVSFVVIIIVLCKDARENSTGVGMFSDSTPHGRALRHSLPLIIVPLLFGIIFSLMIANRISYSIVAHKNKGPYYPLWFAHAIAEPILTLFPPVAFILHPTTLRKLFCCWQSNQQSFTTQADTSYIVPNEFSSSSEDPLVITGNEALTDSSRLLYSTFAS